jgi:hypothetical protein
MTLDLPPGRYHAGWLNPRTGKIAKSQKLESRGRQVEIASPDYAEDIAIAIRRGSE